MTDPDKPSWAMQILDAFCTQLLEAFLEMHLGFALVLTAGIALLLHKFWGSVRPARRRC